MNKGRALAAVALLILAAGWTLPASAQEPCAALRGRVVDAAGKPLALVSIIAQSPAYQGQADMRTPESGRFDFLALPPGVYELRFDLPEHKSIVRRGIVLMAGQTVKLDIVLEPSEIEEDVIVETPLPARDVLSVKSVFRLSSALLEAIPTGRDLRDLQAMTPGAVPDGKPSERAVSILGGGVRGQEYKLDGGLFADPASTYPVGNLNVDILDQVEVISAGKPAAEGPGRGASVHLLSRSGGNSFAGSLRFHLTDAALSMDAFDAAAVSGLALEPSDRTSGLYDVSLNLGGPLWEDRAWYFLNARRLAFAQANPYDPGARLAKLGTGTSTAFDREQGEWMTFLKVTVNATDKIRYAGYFHWNNLAQPVDEASFAPDIAYDATWNHQGENSYATSHTGTFELSSRSRADVRFTYVGRDVPQLSRNIYEYSYYDYVNQVGWGAAPYSIRSATKRTIGEASLTAGLDGLVGESHVLKAGISIEESNSTRDWWRINPYDSLWYDWSAGNPYYVDPSRSIGRLSLWASGVVESSLKAKEGFRRFSLFAQDSIQAGRLALDLGLRFEYNLEFLPVQSRGTLTFEYGPELNAEGLADNDLIEALIAEAAKTGLTSPFEAASITYRRLVEFLNLSPRAGLSYDIFGDGSTALKLSFARDYDTMWTGFYASSNIFSPQHVAWDWYDLDGDMMMDMPDIDDYVLLADMSEDAALNPFTYTDADGVTHKLKAPRYDTFTASLERDLGRDISLSAQFTLRNAGNLISLIDIENGYDASARDANGLIWLPLTVTEPGRDGRLGTSDDGTLTVYGLRADRPAPDYRYANIPEARQRYAAGILSFEKRMSRGWQASASVVLSSYKGDLGSDATASYATTAAYASPNGLTNAYGPLRLDRPFQARLMAAVQLPLGIELGAYFRYMSGAPYGRTLARVYFPEGFGAQTAYATVSAEALGTGRDPAFSSLDLRLHKGFRVGKAGKVDAYLDVFNLLGSSALFEDNDSAGELRTAADANGTPVSISYAASSSYGSILSYYGVRTIRLGARFSF